MLRIWAAIALLLPGCTMAQLEYQSDAFNRAIAISGNQQLLLNAVRSSLDLPLSFSKFVKYTGKENISGSFAPKLPFGSDASRIFDLGPSLSFSPGIQAVEYNDVNIGTAIEKLNTNINYGDFDRYLRAGDPYQLLTTIMVEYVEVHAELYRALRRAAGDECVRRTGKKHPSCAQLDEITAHCGAEPLMRSARLEKGQEYYAFPNVAEHKCGFLKFQFLIHLLRLSQLVTDVEPSEYAVKGKDESGKEIIATRTKVQGKLFFQNRVVQAEYRRIHAKLDRLKIKERGPVKVGFRSPKAIVVYLGQLIALQNYSAEKFTPILVLPDGSKMTLFRVMHAAAGVERSALSVQGPRGDTYYVPHTDYGLRTRDRTLRVLTISSELINAAISEKSLPPPSTIVVR